MKIYRIKKDTKTMIKKKVREAIDTWIATLPEKHRKLIKDNVVCSGSAVSNMINSDGLNNYDFDLFFKSKEAVDFLIEYYKSLPSMVKYNSNRAITLEPLENNKFPSDDNYGRDSSVAIQLITFKYGDIETIQKDFDFAHCLCHYDYKEKLLVIPHMAERSIIRKELIYLSNSSSPFMALARAYKFTQRDLSIHKRELEIILKQILDLKYSSKEEALNSLFQQVSSAYNMPYEEILQYSETLSDDLSLEEYTNKLKAHLLTYVCKLFPKNMFEFYQFSLSQLSTKQLIDLKILKSGELNASQVKTLSKSSIFANLLGLIFHRDKYTMQDFEDMIKSVANNKNKSILFYLPISALENIDYSLIEQLMHNTLSESPSLPHLFAILKNETSDEPFIIGHEGNYIRYDIALTIREMYPKSLIDDIVESGLMLIYQELLHDISA